MVTSILVLRPRNCPNMDKYRFIFKAMILHWTLQYSLMLNAIQDRFIFPIWTRVIVLVQIYIWRFRLLHILEISSLRFAVSLTAHLLIKFSPIWRGLDYFILEDEGVEDRFLCLKLRQLYLTELRLQEVFVMLQKPSQHMYVNKINLKFIPRAPQLLNCQ